MIAVLLIAGMVVVGAGVKLAAPVLAPFLLGALLAIVSAPLMQWLLRHQVPRLLAVSVAIVTDAAALGALGWLFVISISELTANLPVYLVLLARAQDGLTERLHSLSPTLQLPALVHPETITRWTTSLLGDFASLIWNIALALILAAFLLIEVSRPAASASPRENVRRAIREVNKYIAVKTLVSIVTGCLIALWLVLFGADLPVLFGLLAFVLNFIPNLGSILAALPAVGLALLRGGIPHGLVVASGYLLVNVIIGNVVEPRVMGRVLGLRPIVVLLSVVLWGWLLGPVGALASALLTVLVKLALSSTEDLRSFAVILGPSQARAPAALPSQVPEEPEEDLAELVVPQSSVQEPVSESPSD